MSFHRRISVVIVASLGLILIAAANVNAAHFLRLRGSVASDGTGLEGYKVSLLASFVDPVGDTRVLGSDTTDPSGEFEIRYRLPAGLPSRLRPILLVRAEKGPVMLASAIGRAPVVRPVVVNELTTVATGFAFAQFVDGKVIKGNRYGMVNAVHMAANMADPETGGIAEVLDRSPNGNETEARPTFYSLANIVAYCIATEIGCEDLLDAATLPGGPPPSTVLQAVANIAKYPWLNVAALFDLSFEQEVYGPALPPAEQPAAWTLFLKFTGSFSSVQDESNLMNGPGAFAIDRQGFLWVNDNYVPQPPEKPACAGMRLLKFYPWGESFPGSPYFGGGLSGAGFGITIAPDRRIWVGNFGFAGLGCPTPPADSVSVFKPDGTPLAPSPFTAGPISWPQATVADRRGNVWIANCAAASVALYPKGRPHRAFEIPVPGAELVKPFGLAIDHGGNAWVAGTISSSVAVFGPRGDLIEVIPSNGHLTRPMGVAADSRARRALLISGRGPTLRSRCSSATPIVSLMPTRRSAAAASPFPGGSPLTAPIPCGSPISAFPSTWAIPTTRWLGTGPIG